MPKYPRRIELLLLDVTKVLEQFLPPLAEQPWFIAAAPPVLNLIDIQSFEVAAHNVSEGTEEFDYFLEMR